MLIHLDLVILIDLQEIQTVSTVFKRLLSDTP